MDYRIDSTEIVGNGIVARITVTFDDATDLACTVPVDRPTSEEDVIAAIEARVEAERVKWDCGPTLAAVKSALDQRTGATVAVAVKSDTISMRLVRG